MRKNPVKSRIYRNSNFYNLDPKKLLLSGACLSTFALSSTAFAQEEDPLDALLEEIVVTGTYIRGTEVIGSALETVDALDLAASGKATIGDFLREIPINFAGGVGISDEVQSSQDAGPGNANLSGGQGVNLRGLGALSTLVLINGRRVPASGQFGDFVDVSNIPAVAVERIEILKDGASAVYGSDAVGGVVNFILKREVDKPITSLRFGEATEGGGEEISVSQLFGHRWDSGNVLIGLEYYDRNHVKATDRDPYSKGSDFSSKGGVNWPKYSAHYSPIANILLGGQGGSVASPVGARVPLGANTSLTQSDLILSTDGTGSTTNVYEGLDLLPDSKRVSLFTSFDYDINAKVSIYGDLRYTDREANYDLGYGILVDSSVPTTSPYYIQDIDPSLTNADGSIPFSLVIDERLETRESSVESVGGQLGVVVSFRSDWQLDATVSYGREDQNRLSRQLANISLSGRINFVDCALQSPGSSNPDCAALNLLPLNPFSTEPLSPQQVNQLFGFEDLTFESDVIQWTAKVDGTLYELPAGGLKLAAGLDFRTEKIEGDLAWNTGSVVTLTGPYTPTERDALSAFMEFAVPLHQRLDLSIAARYEEFSGTGDYDTFNPKIGFNWRATETWTLRASWGTSFHAPAMRFENDDPQPLPGGNAAFILPVTYRGPCDSDIVEFNGIIGTPGVAGENCSFSVIINSGGAGEGVLKPEEATTWSFGFDFKPVQLPGFRASLNYFDIEIEDRIQRIQGGTFPAIVAELFATGTSPFISALNINPTEAEAQALIDSGKFLGTFGPPIANSAADIQMIVNATQINIATLNTSGVDFSLSYDFAYRGTDIQLFMYGTWLDTYETEAAPGAGIVDQLGKYSSFGAPVELRTKQGISFVRGAFDGILTVNYTDSYECAIGSCMVPGPTGAPVSNTSAVPIDSWTTVDLDLGWNLSNWGGAYMEGTSVRLSLTNLLNKEPPFIDGGESPVDNIPSAYDPNNATIIGRTASLTLTKVW